MRLAALMGRTVAELRETMDAHEWNKWLIFHSLYDLPDAFLVAGQLGALISQVVGGKGKPEDFAPYFKRDSRIDLTPTTQKPAAMKANDLRPAYNFIAAYAKERNLPKSRR